MTYSSKTPPLSGPTIPVSNRTSDDMTVDDLWRARAIALVLNESSMVVKLDAELAAIYRTHETIKAAMSGRR